MFEQRYNGAIRFLLAVTPGEVDELMRDLSPEVLQDLTTDLATSGEAHRYSLAARCAYYFRRRPQEGLACWQWTGVNAYEEAARLLTAIVEMVGPMTPDVAELLLREARNLPQIPTDERSQLSP